MSYATNIVLFNKPPFFLLLAGSKEECWEFRKRKNLRKKTINVLRKRNFSKLDPSECRIILGPNFWKNPVYYTKDWMRFYRQVMDLPEATEEWLDWQVELDEIMTKREKRGEAPE